MLCRIRIFLILSFVCFMIPIVRTGEPGLIIGFPLIFFCFWAIDWLLHHINLRYLWITLGIVAAIVLIVSPTVREVLGKLFGPIFSFESGTLIVLSICFLFTHAVLCWAQPVPQTNNT